MSTDYESDPGWQYLRRNREQVIQDQSAPYDSKRDCWIPDKEEGYIAAQILSKKGDEVVVSVAGTKKTVKADLISQMNPPKFEKTEDMSNLTFLNDASVLHNLRARYSAMLIYTYSGLFCVVINPYKRLPIYTDSVAQMFMGKRKSEMPPHLFAVSDEAYRSMLQNHENQSMLITGESGAGKTENTKKVISYFAFVGASQQAELVNARVSTDGKKKVTLEDQIVQTNPVLEAFGNARTVRNNNSSRFGKFIRIHFSKHGRVASCDIEHYLLEKSRVIHQAPGERCYHIFYQMTSDYKPELKPMLLLDKPMRDYWFVAQAELTVDGMNDAEEFRLTDEAFDILHFTVEEKLNCYKLMAAHMHIGNMKFKQRPREEQAESDGTEEAEKAAQMYGVAADELLKAFTHPRVKVGTEWVNKGQNVDQVNWAVGAMGKAIYARVFNWLVKKCNSTLDQKGVTRDYFIGVLDIAGFEIFDFNSFEQLWINFVNEKLQQFFNHHMFILEQEEYTREGINWTFIDFGLDLEACIELIEKPMGIIAMLDEECIVPKATDMTLAQKLNEQHLGKHPNFEKPKPPKGKQSEAHFAMRHYAGLVRYNVTNWLEKNKDPLNDTVAACLKASKSNALLNEIWADYTTQEEASNAAKSGGQKKKGKSGSFMTVSMLYRESLNNLMSMLYKTHPHFIRCIIPNEKKKSGLLDAALVLNQLTCNGVLEGIRICRKGFPNRTPHTDFVQRYAILGAKESKSSEDPKECAVKMLERLMDEGSMNEEMFKVGLTKVFFKAGALAHLEDLRDARLNYLIACFQAQIRYCFVMNDLKQRRERFEATLIIQRNVVEWARIIGWSWFKLFIDTMPIVRESKREEVLKNLRESVNGFSQKLLIKKEQLSNLQMELSSITAETEKINEEIKHSKSGNYEAEEQIYRLAQQKTMMEKELLNVHEELKIEEHRTAEEVEAEDKLQQQLEMMRRSIQEAELGKRKGNAERMARDDQLRSLSTEVNFQQQNIAKLSKERKQQDEVAEKLGIEVSAVEQRNMQTAIIMTKLMEAVHEGEQRIENEKSATEDANRQKRKMEGELKIARETLEELRKQNEDVIGGIRIKDVALRSASNHLEDQQKLYARILNQAKSSNSKMEVIEEEIRAVREARINSEHLCKEMQAELEEMCARLDEQTKATYTQIEYGKKLESESADLRRKLQQSNVTHSSALNSMRKKSTDVVDELKKHINKIEKALKKDEEQNSQLHLEITAATSQFDKAKRTRVELERTVKQFNLRVSNLQTKTTEQMHEIEGFKMAKRQITSENSELKLRQKELEEQISAISLAKTHLVDQLKEANRMRVEETHERQRAGCSVRNLQSEVVQLRSVLDDEIHSNEETRLKLNSAESELQQWRSRFTDETLIAADAVDDVRKKQTRIIDELQKEVDTANIKIIDLEKTKLRMSVEAEKANKEVEQCLTLLSQLEKNAKTFNDRMDNLKMKVDGVTGELDEAQRNSRNTTIEVCQEQAMNDKLTSEVQCLHQENDGLREEIKELYKELTEGTKMAEEVRNLMRRLQTDKEDLQQTIDETEAAVEMEEEKRQRLQSEIGKIRDETGRILAEKDEQLQNAKIAHQRAIDAIKEMIEATKREKAELQRSKTKLEIDIKQLEVAFAHANEANEDARANALRHGNHIVELQNALEKECAKREQFREQYIDTEKKLTAIQSEKEELIEKQIQMANSMKHYRNEVCDIQEHNDRLSAQTTEVSLSKRKLDADFLIISAQLDETLNEMKISEGRSREIEADAARLSEALREEQKRSELAEKAKKGLEATVRQLQAKIDQAETAMLRGGRKTVTKLEQRLDILNAEIEMERRRYQDVLKNIAKHERKARQLEFEVTENKKRVDEMQQAADKLHKKAKEQKKVLDETEEAASDNLQRYKQFYAAFERAEERAENAENSLLKTDAKKANQLSEDSLNEI